MDNREISHALREVALLIELSDPNPKKAITYKRAANALDSIGNLDELIKNQQLEEIPGLGKTVSRMVISLAKTNKLPYLETLKEEVPYSLVELSHLPALGAKRIRTLYEQLNVKSVDELEQAIESGVLKEIGGFGPTLIKKIQSGIEYYKREGCVLAYSSGDSLGEAIKASLVTDGLASRSECSLHYLDINLVALAKDPETCLEAFKRHYFVQSILGVSRNYAKVFLKQGFVASLLVVPERKFPVELFELDLVD